MENITEMCKTKIIQFRVEKSFFDMMMNRANSKGFVRYCDYLRDLCKEDNMNDLKIHEKLNRILEKLNVKD